MKLELTQQEAQVLVNLLDVAVKAMGLQAAEAAVVLAKKVQDANTAANAETAVVQEAA